MSGCLYKLSFPDGKQYVGITAFTAEERWRRHRYTASAGAPHAVHAAIRKFGPDAVQVETLVVAPESYLPELERAAIIAFGTLWPSGYNLTGGGDGVLGLAPEQAALRLQRSNEAQARPDVRDRKRRAWTAAKRQAQALRIAMIGAQRAPEIAAKQREVMAAPEARAQIARTLSRHANALFVKGRKPLRGGFTRHIWEQIPEPATFDQLFALGFSKGRLGKALKNNNLVRLDGSSPLSGESSPAAAAA